MATNLVLTFQTSSGDKTTFTFPYAKSNATANQVRSAVNAIITNGSIFEDVPVTAHSAKIVTTTETDISLSA